MDSIKITYSYINLAHEFERTERTMYRWVAALKQLHPDTIITVNGRVTEEGYALIIEHKQELEKKFEFSDDDLEIEDGDFEPGAENSVSEDSDPPVQVGSEIVHRYMGGDLPSPDFDVPKDALSDLVSVFTKAGKELGYALGYQTTIAGLGNGLNEGRLAAIQEISTRASL